MIDTQNNLLTTLLAALLGAFVLIGLVLLVIFGRVDVDRIAPHGETTVPRVEVAVADSELEPFDEYVEILRRPVFFSDRRLPVVEVVDEDEGAELAMDDEIEEESVADLKATVAGIVITPDLRMAMINDQEINRTVVLREGMSLEGEQAAWRLDRISARQVDFVSVDGQRTNLELKVNTRGLTAPTLQRQTRDAEAAGETDAEAVNGEQERAELDDEARTRAEEIRRRVAERRAELRAEAERRAQEQQENQ